jgi:hypothetical protein
MLNRRNLLGWATIAPMLMAARPATALTHTAVLAEGSAQQSAADLARYIGFGIKASGGQGDNASGLWIEQQLQAAGYQTERSPFDIPYFDATQSDLRVGPHRARLIPQALVRQTPAQGLKAKLSYVKIGEPHGDLAGTIVLLDLPHQFYSSAEAPVIRDALALAEKGGAVGAILITNGPTGEGVALNAPKDHPLFQIPVAVLSPADAPAFIAAAANSELGHFTLSGRQGMRQAFNVVGRITRSADYQTIILNTPRSGWFTCAAERGPGVAVWLDLVRWTAAQDLPFNIIVTATSGHEYENVGILHQIAKDLPAPDQVALYLLYGAGTATRDSDVRGGEVHISDRPTQQRSILLTPDMTDEAQRILSGWESWADPRFTHDGGAGEVGAAMRAGYHHVVGFAAANPFHHVASDTGSLVDAGLVRKVAIESRQFIRNAATRAR